jgi:hypothetical protein
MCGSFGFGGLSGSDSFLAVVLIDPGSCLSPLDDASVLLRIHKCGTLCCRGIRRHIRRLLLLLLRYLWLNGSCSCRSCRRGSIHLMCHGGRMTLLSSPRIWRDHHEGGHVRHPPPLHSTRSTRLHLHLMLHLLLLHLLMLLLLLLLLSIITLVVLVTIVVRLLSWHVKHGHCEPRWNSV